MMNTYNSQGELVQQADNGLMRKDIKNEHIEGHEGNMLTGIWDAVKSTTLSAAHMAEMGAIIAGEAAHKAKEAASELVETGMEKVHEASDKVEELVAHLQVLSPRTELTRLDQPTLPSLEEKTDSPSTSTPVLEQVKEKMNEVLPVAEHMLEKAKEGVSAMVDMAKEELSKPKEEIMEDAKNTASAAIEQATQLARDAAPVVQQVAEQAMEKMTSMVDMAKEELSKPKEEIMEDAKNTASVAVEQASKLARDAAPVVQQAAEQAMEKGKMAYSSMMRSTSAAPLMRSMSQSVVRGPQQRQMPRSMSTNWRSSRMEPSWNQQQLVLTMDAVSHLQRIADRTGDALLHETARKAHSACAKGLSEAPGVHLTWVTPQQANDLVNLAICTQDHELADFARYCQSVAATSHIAIEPTPGKIQQEILKGHKELQLQGRLHTGPGYGAAFASVNRNYNLVDPEGPVAPPSSPASVQAGSDVHQVQRARSPSNNAQQEQRPVAAEEAPLVKPELVLSMDVVSHVQRIADRTGNEILHDTARKAHSAFAKGQSEAPGVHLTWVTPQLASELMNLASRTGDKEVIDFARYCQSVAATTQIGVEPSPGKIQEEILKAQQKLQQLPQQQQEQQPLTTGMAAQ